MSKEYDERLQRPMRYSPPTTLEEYKAWEEEGFERSVRSIMPELSEAEVAQACEHQRLLKKAYKRFGSDMSRFPLDWMEQMRRESP